MVGEACESPSHWSSGRSLAAWMEEEGVPGIQGLDTRALAKIIRHLFFPSNIVGLHTNSAVDPDPDPDSRGPWIRIANPDPDPEGHKLPTNIEINKFPVHTGNGEFLFAIGIRTLGYLLAREKKLP